MTIITLRNDGFFIDNPLFFYDLVAQNE